MILFLLLSLAVPSAANACAVFIGPEQRLKMAFERSIIKAVAIVEVTSAKHLQPRKADYHPWRADARIVRSLHGPDLPSTVGFERGWGSSMCEWNLPPLPKQGDKWVVYFWKDNSGQLRPWLTMTLAEAKGFDPALMTRSR